MPKRVGRCKICAWDRAKEFNRRVAQGNLTSATALAWSAPKGLTFDRKTFYAHRDHSKHPADALVSYGERALALSVPTVTNSQFLETIRDLGFQKANADPDSVNLSHALKAVDLMERRQDQSRDLMAALAKVVLGARVNQVVTIEGTATEVSV